MEASAEFSLMSTGCEGNVTELWPPMEVVGRGRKRLVLERLNWNSGERPGPAEVLLGSVRGR